MASEAESLGATETVPRREPLASNNWGWFALRGVLATTILLGIVFQIDLVTHPGPTILSVGWVIGLYALAAGIVLLVQAFRLRSALRT